MILLSVRTTETSPLPLCASTFQPWSAIQLRNATSCVLPSCGVAIFLPLTSFRDLIFFGFTTSFTPPDAEPPMMRRLLPWDLVKPLIAGEGPIQPMSIEPELSASISEGPALKMEYSAFVPPSAFWKRPSWRPTRAVACVRLPK